ARADDDRRHAPAGQDPGQRDGGRRRADLGGDLADLDSELNALVVKHPPPEAAAGGPAALRRRLSWLVLAGEHAAAQRAVDHGAEALALAGRQDVVLDPPRVQRVTGLQADEGSPA